MCCSLAYTSPKLLEVSTRGKVNIKVSDDPLYNLVKATSDLYTSIDLILSKVLLYAYVL